MCEGWRRSPGEAGLRDRLRFPGIYRCLFRQVKNDFGIDKLVEPERFAVFIDHMVPRFAEGRRAAYRTRDWCTETSIFVRAARHRPPGRTEVGYAVPGAFVVHFDGHISQLGPSARSRWAFAATSLRRSCASTSHEGAGDHARQFRRQAARGVMARDVFHHIWASSARPRCRFHVWSWRDGLADFRPRAADDHGLAMFTGALTAIVNPETRTRSLRPCRARARSSIRVYSDADADIRRRA